MPRPPSVAGLGRPRASLDPAEILANERSVLKVEYETNRYGHRCMKVMHGTQKVAGATVEFLDYVMARTRRTDLPRGLRELIAIRRNHAAPMEGPAA